MLQSKSIDPGSTALSKSGRDSTETGNIREELAENEKLIQECTKTWEEKEKQTEMIHKVLHILLFFLTSFKLILVLSSIAEFSKENKVE